MTPGTKLSRCRRGSRYPTNRDPVWSCALMTRRSSSRGSWHRSRELLFSDLIEYRRSNSSTSICLLIRRAACLLRGEVADIEHAAAVALDAIVNGVRLHREAVAVGPRHLVFQDDRGTDCDEGRRMAQRVVRRGLGGVGVRVELQRAVVVDRPFDVEANRIEVVLLSFIGLLEAHVLRAVVDSPAGKTAW